MSEVTAEEWDTYLAQFPDAHVLQTTAWGKLKEGFGWEVVRLVSDRCGAQVFIRKLPLGFTLAYIPKGPVGELESCRSLWSELDVLAKKYKAILLKVEPDIWQFPVGDKPDLLPHGFSKSRHSIQPLRTIVVNLKEAENSILSRMKQKTRYNIRLAAKKGVIVRLSADIELFHRMMMETGERDQFGVHTLEYYQRAYSLFQPKDACQLLIAEHQSEPLAGIMVFLNGSRVWYFYGASSSKRRELMPNYILQWEAMRWARNQGCTEYDLWGVPDENYDTLEANFTQRSDGLWGVYRFKRGFGGELRRAAEPWDRVYNATIYKLYQIWASKPQD